MRYAPVSATFAKLLLLSVIATPVLGGQPEGFETYLGMKDQFTLALPEGWSVYDQGLVMESRPRQDRPSSLSLKRSTTRRWGQGMKGRSRNCSIN